jgi:hypothetical protein
LSSAIWIIPWFIPTPYVFVMSFDTGNAAVVVVGRPLSRGSGSTLEELSEGLDPSRLVKPHRLLVAHAIGQLQPSDQLVHDVVALDCLGLELGIEKDAVPK